MGRLEIPVAVNNLLFSTYKNYNPKNEVVNGRTNDCPIVLCTLRLRALSNT